MPYVVLLDTRISNPDNGALHKIKSLEMGLLGLADSTR